MYFLEVPGVDTRLSAKSFAIIAKMAEAFLQTSASVTISFVPKVK